MSSETNRPLTVRAKSSAWYAGVEFLIRHGSAIATKIVMETAEEGKINEPSFRLDNTQAQVLMDDLWNAGLRPTEGTGSAGSLRATEKHLEDMRRLVFEFDSTKKNV